MEIRYYGHSCFSILTGGKHVLFDPFIRGNELASHIDVTSIRPDYIFVSHGHGDHMADAVEIAKASGATLVGVYELTNWFQNKGVEKVHPMNIGGGWNFDFGRVTLTYASHSSSFPDGSYAGVAAGFMVEAEGKCIYYSGDTALNQEMKLLGERYAIELSLLPIGDNFTMDYKDAAQAAEWLGCKKVIGVHFDTFGYIKIDHEAAKEAFSKKNIALTLLNPGGTFAF